MSIFVEIGIIILIATGVSIIMRLLKQPLVVGYILSGIIVGPYFLNLIEATGDYLDLFAKFGIAILLFIIGLSLKPDVIREVGKTSLIIGLGQVIFTSVAGFFLIKLLGFDFYSAILGAIALTFSSTIIVLKLISDKDDLNKSYAKIAIGMLLVQDVVATFALLFLSISNSASFLEGNMVGNIAILVGKGLLFFAVLYFASKYILPKLLNFLAKSQELLFLFSISWGIGLAAIFNTLGFSLEIGALAAGVSLASSPFSQEAGSRMKPLRDFFVLLFFVMLGSQMILSDITGVLLPAILLSIFVLIFNPIIVFIIMNLLGFRNRTSFFTGLTVAQISEFSLILVALGSSLGYLSREFVSLITVVGIVTIAGSTYLFINAESIYSKIKPLLHAFGIRKSIKNREEVLNTEKDMVIFGYDRVGYDFVKIAKKMGIIYAVVDLNPEVIKTLKRENIPCYFGDADDIDFIEEIGLQKSKIVVSTIPDFKTNLGLVSFYQNHNKDGIIIVISHNIKNTKELYKHGASFVVMPHYLGAKHASQMIENFAFKKEAFEEEKKHHLEYLEERQKKTE